MDVGGWGVSANNGYHTKGCRDLGVCSAGNWRTSVGASTSKTQAGPAGEQAEWSGRNRYRSVRPPQRQGGVLADGQGAACACVQDAL